MVFLPIFVDDDMCINFEEIMISVVLVNWNGWKDTIACLQSLLNSDTVPARFIVVDNASSNDSIERIRQWANKKIEVEKTGDECEKYALQGKYCSRHIVDVNYNDIINNTAASSMEFSLHQMQLIIYLVCSPRNGGFGYGCNVGMSLAKQLGTDVIWLLNNDCVVKSESLKIIYNHVLKNKNTIFGTVLKYYYKPNRTQAIGGGHLSRLTGSVSTFDRPSFRSTLNFINGASMAVCKEIFEAIGGFDENIFMYFEENDFCIRAEKAGYKFDVIDTDVFHKHGGSLGCKSTVRSWEQVYINKHYVLKKNFGWGVWVFFFFFVLVIRSLLPVGQQTTRQGARRALAHFIFGKVI